ncbi:MAG: hypothetical protein NC230_06995 [Bacteroides sp.]|nr:hypothetical protein [Bacteroides sp.]
MKGKIFASISAGCLALASLATWACNSKNDSKIVVENPAIKESVVENVGNDHPTNIANEKAADRWADSVLNTLTPRQRIAQLFIPRLDITNNQAGYQKVAQMIEKEKMGGFLLGKGTIESYADLINRGQKLANVPLMITLDGEWGLSMRIPGTPRFPYSIALGAANDEKLMYEYGKEMARECKLMGIQVNFAPVLDVNSNPDNPVIGYRSFGEDPDLVGRLGTAYCQGMYDYGVMPVGKHFPGHGDTSTDSHKTLPIVDHSIATLQSVDMLPFKMAIESGVPGIMVGHLKVPALDNSGTPSSLSKKITTDWLIDSLGFKGLIFTDALAMKGASRVNENNCVSAFLAGADILLGSSNPVADLAAVETAVKAGKIKQSDVDVRCRKMLKYKYLLGLDRKPMVDAKTVKSKLNTTHVDSLILAMSRKAVTVVKDERNLLPTKDKKAVVINIGAPATNSFADNCKKYGATASYSIESAAVPATVINAAKQADVVLIAVYKDTSWAKTAFQALSSVGNSVGVFFINPFKVNRFQGLSKLNSLILAYDDVPQLRVAAAEAVYGKIKVSGKLPVNLSAIGKIGTGISY